ncbi:MAG TPA: hypothetical protein VJ654_12315 [Noviherbaspirillum sp.]|nr:hypothetical protein [Noviherbaspirillum sp.]
MQRMPHMSHENQAGFSIVSAIFLLVVLAALGAAMVTFSTVQHTTAAQDMQGSRAYQAARAGIEWGLYQTQIAGGRTTCPASPTTLPALADDLATFTVVVTCNVVTFNEAGVDGIVFVITSTASAGTPGTTNRVERRLEVRV